MQLILHARDGMHATIRNLSFPATAIIAPVAGAVRGSHRGHSRLFGPARRLALRPFTPIALDLGAGAAVIIDASLDLTGPLDACDAWRHDAASLATTPPLTSLLARHVVAAPHHDWTLDAFAAIAGLSRASLSRRLFAEGASFREIVRTHRLLRVLIDLSRPAPSLQALGTGYGFADRCQRENAVFDQFGVSLERLRRLVTDKLEGIPEHPACSRKNPPPQYRWHAPPVPAIQCEVPPAWARTPCLP